MLGHQCSRVLLQSVFRTLPRIVHTSSVLKEVFDVSSEDELKQKIASSSKPFLIDFYANWCKHCQMQMPIVEKIVAETGGAVNLAKVDVDKHLDLALGYNVDGLPTIIVVKNGQTTDTLIGFQRSDALEEFVKRAM